MKYAKVEREIAGRTFSMETGRIAKQAAGSVLASYGDSMVLSAVCASKARPGLDFFPLTVDYREKTYAAGKFPGGFLKREGRPSNKEILTCRLIDRPVRPLWPDAYKDEVQIMATVVSADRENDPDLIAMNASFAALALTDLPFSGPISAVRVGRRNGKLEAFPTIEQRDEGDLDLIVAASRDALVMVEGEAFEILEDDFMEALDYAREVCDELLDLQLELRKKAGWKKPAAWEGPEVERHSVISTIKRGYAKKVKKALLTDGKHEREDALKALKSEAAERYADPEEEDFDARKSAVSTAFSEMKTEGIRSLIVKDGQRIDGRGLEDIRDITIEAGILPRVHGSSLFTRGETQALVAITLGTPRDQQMVDTLMEEYSKRLDLHYNFPPYCVGECRPVRGVSRREIGHGNLAERALSSIIPAESDFPYTIRIVSEITESNGSSSMASVCGGTLAMMDAGVPIRQPVAGIAMGLVEEKGEVAILSDILGTEDHVGDMDFKVAGTGRGITAVQMDIKIKGLTREIMADALSQAKRGRLHILREMVRAVERPNADISQHAPRLMQIKIPQEKIGMVIGPGGKMIKRIQEETGANVEIDDEGIVSISCADSNAAREAKSMVEHLTAEVEVGRVYRGRVVAIKDFGCFVEVLPGQEGLCHISELDVGHVNEVGDVVQLGADIDVKIILRDEQGRLKLSRKAVLEGGLSPDGVAGGPSGGPPAGGGDRPPRGGRDGGRDGGPRGRDDRPPRGRGRDEERPPRRPRDDDDRGPRGRGRDDERPPRRPRDEDDRPRRGPRDEDDRGPRGRGRDDEDRPPRRSRDDEDRPRRGSWSEVGSGPDDDAGDRGPRGGRQGDDDDGFERVRPASGGVRSSRGDEVRGSRSARSARERTAPRRSRT